MINSSSDHHAQPAKVSSRTRWHKWMALPCYRAMMRF